MIKVPFSIEQFTQLGEGYLTYVKEINFDDAKAFFPDSLSMEPGDKFFALFSAGGLPLGLAESREVAIASAFQSNLSPLSLH